MNQEGPIGSAETAWDKVIKEANVFLQQSIGGGFVDEIALMFCDVRAAQDFVFEAVLEEGVSHFNASVDHVETQPIPSEYSVRYDFLQKLGKAYRVECMTMMSGVSPLHSVLAKTMAYHSTIVVHLSFKTYNLKAYQETCETLAKNLTLAQKCKSTYGEFSYWNFPLANGSTIYLKPRVNTRDLVTSRGILDFGPGQISIANSIQIP